MKKFMLTAFILSAALSFGSTTPVMAQSVTGGFIAKSATQQKIVLQNFFYKLFEIYKTIEKNHKDEALKSDNYLVSERDTTSRDTTSRGTERGTNSVVGSDGILPYEYQLPQIFLNENNNTVAPVQQVATPTSAPATITPTLTSAAITPTATPKPTPIPTSTPKPTPKPVATPTVTTSQSIANNIIATGKQYLGVPYVWGGTSPSGFDCSGFTSYVYKAYGYTIPRTSAEQSRFGQSVSKDNLIAGDLIFFTTDGSGGPSHVGIYMGNGQFIHASSGAKKVTISNLSTSYYAQRYLNARRIIR